jgi:hypothetical protein
MIMDKVSITDQSRRAEKKPLVSTRWTRSGRYVFFMLLLFLGILLVHAKRRKE